MEQELFKKKKKKKKMVQPCGIQKKGAWRWEKKIVEQYQGKSPGRGRLESIRTTSSTSSLLALDVVDKKKVLAKGLKK